MGFVSCSAQDPLAHAARRLASSTRRQELVQRRIEQTDRHRQAGHRLEDALEVRLLHRQQLVERGAALVPRRAARIIARTTGRRSLGHEHVLGAAEADALGAELARLRASGGVSAFARTPRRRIPSAHASSVSKSPLTRGAHELDVADA